MELLCEIRKKEDLIINKKRDLEDEIQKFREENNNKINKMEENIKLYQRSKTDLFLQKKRQIENEEIELENLNNLYKTK